MCIDSMLFVLCNGCKADGPAAGTVDEAEAAWNNREGAAMDLAAHAHGEGLLNGQRAERAQAVAWLKRGLPDVAAMIEAGKHWEK